VYRISEVEVLVRRLRFDPVADRNCVAARRGGEHRKANVRSVTQVNSIRPIVVASLQAKGEADVPQSSQQRDGNGRAVSVADVGSKTQTHGFRHDGGCLETERREGSIHEAKRPAGNQTAFIVLRVDAKSRPAGVRAFIVATKRGNARGAKGRRKMDSQ
jgi:hypothetical protein